MNANDLKELMQELLSDPTERKRQAHDDIAAIGGDELLRRLKELQGLYPGQAEATQVMIHETSEALLPMLKTTANFCRTLPHSLSDFAWDVMAFHLKAGVLQCEENKRLDAKRRKSF